MAKIDRFMIAPIEGGLQTDLKPWLIPDNAFAQLNNAYVFRGRVRKRFGSYLMNQAVNSSVQPLHSRLRIQVGTTDAVTGNFAPTVMPGVIWAIGQMFSVGNTMFTVYQSSGATLTTGSATATYNTSNGTLQIIGNTENASTAVYFYPAQPVIGIITYENGVINSEPVFAFDTQFAYQFTSSAWERLGTMTWSGPDYKFFWGYTYRGISNSGYYLFVTNFNVPDRQAYWDGSDWNTLSPIINGTFRLLTSRMILPFKDRLICLNTVENQEGIVIGTTDNGTGNFSGTVSAYPGFTAGQTFLVGTTVYTITNSSPGAQAMLVTPISPKNPPTGTFDVSNGNIVITGNNNNPNQTVFYLGNTGGTQFSYVNRCRFSQNGSPTSPNAWVDTFGGKGGYIDAPTKEQIVTCEFLKDRLIVYFERSCWELVYTGNEILPFRWQQINTELGAEATFSTVPFDKVVLGIGNVGVHACNGSNVERIDNKIPDEVFQISNDNEGVFRVYGIRDYEPEMVYWTFPCDTNSPTSKYPNRVLVFNYKNGSWSLNYDTITAFGYYQGQSAVTWANSTATWEQSLESWDSGVLESSYRQVLAGNQEGFMFIVNYERTRNAPSMQITQMEPFSNPALVEITVVNHNLRSLEDYVCIENAQGFTILNPVGDSIFPVFGVIDKDTITIQPTSYSGTYHGGGTLCLVSRIDIYTKQYNFYVQEDRNTYVSKVDFLVEATSEGEITVDTYVSSSVGGLRAAGMATGAMIGTGVLETSPYTLSTFEQSQVRLWHPLYFQAEGECVQLRIYMSYLETITQNIAWSGFELHAMTFFATRTSSRLQ